MTLTLELSSKHQALDATKVENDNLLRVRFSLLSSVKTGILYRNVAALVLFQGVLELSMRRMNNVTSPEQIDTEERSSRVEMNPMLNGTSIPGQPSAAFLESLRKALSSSTWQDAQIMSSGTSTDIRNPGPKTKFAVIAFLLTG